MTKPVTIAVAVVILVAGLVTYDTITGNFSGDAKTDPPEEAPPEKAEAEVPAYTVDGRRKLGAHREVVFVISEHLDNGEVVAVASDVAQTDLTTVVLFRTEEAAKRKAASVYVEYATTPLGMDYLDEKGDPPHLRTER